MQSHRVRTLASLSVGFLAALLYAGVWNTAPSAQAVIQLTKPPCATPQTHTIQADPVSPTTNLLTQTITVRGEYIWVRVTGPAGAVASSTPVSDVFVLTVPLIIGRNELVVTARLKENSVNGCSVYSQPAPTAVTVDATSAVPPSPPHCPEFAPPFLFVDALADYSEGTARVSVVDAGFEWVRVDGGRYPATNTTPVNGLHEVDMLMQKGTNEFRVTARARDRVIGACIYPVQLLPTTQDYLARPLSFTVTYTGFVDFGTKHVLPVISQTQAFVQDVSVRAPLADAITITLFGSNQFGAREIAQFLGVRNGAMWKTPIDLRKAGGLPLIESRTYSLAVAIHTPAMFYFPEELITLTQDVNRKPLQITLGPTDCTAIAFPPVTVNPIMTRTNAFTLVLTGTKSDLVDGVLVYGARRDPLVEFPTRFTWQAEVPLQARSVHTLSVIGRHRADTLCEARTVTDADTEGGRLLITQVPDHVYFFPGIVLP